MSGKARQWRRGHARHVCRCEMSVVARVYARTHLYRCVCARARFLSRSQADAFSIPRIHPRTATPWPTFISGNNRHKRAPLVHPRAESLLLDVPLPSSVYVRYAPARARHTRCNLLRGSSVLPMSPISSSFVRTFSRVITYASRYSFAACGELAASLASERAKLCASTILQI